MKQPSKTEPKSDQAKALEAIAAIAAAVLACRNSEKPTLAEVARIADRASGLLRLKSEERWQSQTRRPSTSLRRAAS